VGGEGVDVSERGGVMDWNGFLTGNVELHAAIMELNILFIVWMTDVHT
jgi:hypothetical protein